MYKIIIIIILIIIIIYYFYSALSKVLRLLTIKEKYTLNYKTTSISIIILKNPKNCNSR
jgi:hypothetical protein